MSIKSELRLIEQQIVPITNGSFLKNTDGWENTGTTTWIQSSFNNSIRKISGDTTSLSQELPFSASTVSLTHTENSVAYKVDFTIFGQQSGFTFAPVLGGVSGATVTENGVYSQIFYIDDGTFGDNYILINDEDYVLINATGDGLIWQ